MAFDATNVALTLPKVTLIANDFGGALTLPAVTLLARDLDAYASISVPAPTLEVGMIIGAVGSLEADLPIVDTIGTSLTGELGEATLAIPAVTLTAESLSGLLWSAEIALPKVELTASGLANSSVSFGSANLTLPAVLLEASGLANSVAVFGSLTKDLPAVISSGLSLTGEIGVGAITVPAVTTGATTGAEAFADIELPVVTLEATGYQEITWTAGLSVPAVQLIASGISSGEGTTTLPAADYEVWVINMVSKAHSTYTNWQANSYGKFNGAEYIVLPDGIYQLTTGDDETTDVDATVEWVQSDLGSNKQKRIDSLSINMRNLDQSDIEIIAKVDETEERHFTKRITSTQEGMRRHRQLMPKGLQGQTWQLSFKNKDGASFVLDEIEVLTEELSRRFK